MAHWYNVGKIVNTHGIRGEIRVISRTDFAEERYKIGNKLFIFKEEALDPLEVIVKSHRVHKTFDLLTFEGFDNVNEVETLKGSLVKIPESQLSELDEDEYYFHEIIGCTVFTTQGEEIGVVKEVLTPGANDVWVVKRPKGKDALIPYIHQIVSEVNVVDKKIIIEPMEGLLE